MKKDEFYHISFMDEEFYKLPNDETLTIHSSIERGYVWTLDLGHDSPLEALELAMHLIKTEGWKLGKRRFEWPEKGIEQDRGVYKPLSVNRKK